MSTVTPAPSVAVMTVRELAAFASRLTTLTIAPDERAEVLGILREACEAFAAVSSNIANDVAEETPAGGTLGTPDQTPPAGRLVMGLSHASDYLCAARYEFKGAVEACEDLAAEQVESSEEPDRLSAMSATPDAQALLATLRSTLRARHGVTR